MRRVNAPYNEAICAENNVDMFQTGDLKHIPHAEKPDF